MSQTLPLFVTPDTLRRVEAMRLFEALKTWRQMLCLRERTVRRTAKRKVFVHAVIRCGHALEVQAHEEGREG